MAAHPVGHPANLAGLDSGQLFFNRSFDGRAIMDGRHFSDWIACHRQHCLGGGQASRWFCAPPGHHGCPATTDLTKRIKALEDRVRELESDRHARSIPLDAADKLAAYLQQFGSRRVIVSCIPDDIEAYQYANQIVNILKRANWDTQGPELTRVFGDFRTPKINIFVNAADHSDTAKLLLDGFAKFNIPYQSGVTPSQVIPDTETVELFIGRKQSDS
jgi:hypothetical protein